MKQLAYITHIENCLNLDIDFGIDLQRAALIGIDKANHSTYTFIDQDGDVNSSTTYRSRLMGIANKNKGKYIGKIKSLALNEFTNAINRCGRFVYYEIYGCDTYNRVIVKLYDPVSGKCLNDIFLETRFSGAFGPYDN